MMTLLQIIFSLALHQAPARMSTSAPPVLPVRAAYRATLSPDGNIFPDVTIASDTIIPLASLTKLATAMVLYMRGLDWDQEVHIQKEDVRGGGIPYFVPGETVTMRDLWYAMLTGSSNDATIALLRASGISEGDMVNAMQEQAQALGLKRTHFADPTGLSPENVGTAREVGALLRVALSIPEVRSATRASSYALPPYGVKTRIIKNTNLFLQGISLSSSIIGGKTGHIDESGYHLAMVAENSRDTSRILGIILGAATNDERFIFMKKLIRK